MACRVYGRSMGDMQDKRNRSSIWEVGSMRGIMVRNVIEKQ